ncbi:MAG: AMP-binding protein [Phycisphaerales bacterium]|nr:AMP-binding protein [Phycisphaerales bacterium]
MRVARSILRQWLRHPFRVFAVDDFRQWRGASLYLVALHLAKAVERVSNRDRIGIFLPTSGMSASAILAGWLLGRTVVPLNYLLSREELEYIIEDAELDVVISVGPMLERFGSMPGGVEVIRMDQIGFGGVPPLRRLVRRPEDFLAVLLYTSGTSGRPKGVMLTGKNLHANIEQCIEWARFDKRDGFIGVLPQFHSFGLTVTTLLPMAIGCRVYYTAKFKVTRVLELLREYRPTAMIAIPSMYNALLQAKTATPEHFSQLRYIVSGGEPLPDAVYDGFRDRFNVRICEGYGLTETAPVTNWTLPEYERRGTVGQTLPGVEEVIVDEEGRHLGPGQDGEIRIRGENVMAGYFKLPEATAAVFDDDGYFRTGDMGQMDEKGFLSITGRIKEMLIISGENVFPREMEEVLNRHPSVSDAAVIGQADPSRGEVPIAFVELLEGASIDPAEVRAFCREILPPYKVPREIRVLDALPRNPTGKIQRRALIPMLSQVDGKGDSGV